MWSDYQARGLSLIFQLFVRSILVATDDRADKEVSPKGKKVKGKKDEGMATNPTVTRTPIETPKHQIPKQHKSQIGPLQSRRHFRITYTFGRTADQKSGIKQDQDHCTLLHIARNRVVHVCECRIEERVAGEGLHTYPCAILKTRFSSKKSEEINT